MKANYKKTRLSSKYTRILKLKSLLIRSGNKERTNSFLFSLFQLIKTCTVVQDKDHAVVNFVAKNPLNTLGEKNPFKIVDKCLHDLMPAFILRKTFVAGRFYNLPVPISNNRASFMAADWLRKAAFKDNKNAFTIPYLLTREVGAVLHNTGSACLSLQDYIAIALDQRPFSRYLRKKRKIVAFSKRGVASNKLRKRFKKNRKVIRKRRWVKNQKIRRGKAQRKFQEFIQGKNLRTKILKKKL